MGTDDSSETTQPVAAPPQALFHEMYEEGRVAPWDIGRPQADIVALAEAGGFRGDVLDVGCGPGDQAIWLASRGLSVTAVDMVPNALAMARERAAKAGASVRFELGNALELEKLGRTFDTVLDSGLFHVFDDALRARYVESLGRVVRPGGMYYMLVFSDREPGAVGPRRVSQAEIRRSFSSGWRVVEIRPARWEHRVDGEGFAQAWLASIERLG